MFHLYPGKTAQPVNQNPDLVVHIYFKLFNLYVSVELYEYMIRSEILSWFLRVWSSSVAVSLQAL